MYRSIAHTAIACFVLVSLIVLTPSQSLATTSGNMKDQRIQQNIPLNQKHWQIIASPNVGTIGSQLNGVAAVTARDIWSVGEYYNPVYSTETLAEHWNGSTWQVVTSPNNGTDINQLNGVAAVAKNDVWAVGFYRNGPLRTLIEHWDGTQWSIIASPNVGTDFCQLYGIAAIAVHDVWAVGEDAHIPPHFTLSEYWNGKQWSIVPSPNPSRTYNTLAALIVVSGNLWSVGNYYNTQTKAYQTLVEFYRL